MRGSNKGQATVLVVTGIAALSMMACCCGGMISSVVQLFVGPASGGNVPFAVASEEETKDTLPNVTITAPFSLEEETETTEEITEETVDDTTENTTESTTEETSFEDISGTEDGEEKETFPRPEALEDHEYIPLYDCQLYTQREYLHAYNESYYIGHDEVMTLLVTTKTAEASWDDVYLYYDQDALQIEAYEMEAGEDFKNMTYKLTAKKPGEYSVVVSTNYDMYLYGEAAYVQLDIVALDEITGAKVYVQDDTEEFHLSDSCGQMTSGKKYTTTLYDAAVFKRNPCTECVE